jgi:hypothetical protein
MTTSLYDAAALIRARFATQITTGQNLLTVHDNAPNFTLPGEGRWCRLSIRFGQQDQQTVGGASSGRFRTVGIAQVQLFEPIGNGDGTQLELVDAIVTAFRGVVLAGPPPIHFDPAYISAPPFLDGSLWLQVVTIPFRIEEQA